jgi:hypothetical protein
MGSQKCVVNVTSPNVDKTDGLTATMDPTCNGSLAMLFHVQTGGEKDHPENPGITIDWKLAE